MSAGKVYKTYAIVVIEAIWPSQDDYRGEDGKNLLLTTELDNTSLSTSTELMKYSPLQNRYTGYYKIIPLNILSVDVSANKETSTANVSFTADRVIFYSEKSLPQYLQKILETNSVRIKDVGIENFPFLEKVLSTDEKLWSGYLVNYNTIAEYIRELDTVSIYLLNIPEKLSDTFLPVYTGLNPGRTKQPEFTQLNNKKANQLYNVGISANDINFLKASLSSNDFKNLIYFFRKFSFGFIITKEFQATKNIVLLGENREKIKDNEIKNILEVNRETFLSQFGEIIYNYYFFDETARKRLKNECIERYYKANTDISKIISWSAFETIRLRLNELLSVSPGLCFNRNSNEEKSKQFSLLVRSLLLENLLVLFAPESVRQMNKPENLSIFVEKVNQTLANLKINVKFSPEDYLSGAKSFLKRVVELYKNISVPETKINVDELNDTISVNMSGDGLGLVFRGHITDIKRSLSISETDANILLSFSAKGFDHQLNRSEIYPDLTSIKFAAYPATNFSIKVLTPVKAILSIIDTFAPYKVRVRKLDNNSLTTFILEPKGFTAYYKVSNTNPEMYVSHGNVVAPSYDAKYEDLIVFTPLHYVGLDFIKKLNSAFDEELLSQRYLANTNIDVPSGPIFSALKKVISQNSAYKVYVDNFGYLRFEFEIANIVSPFSLNANPPATEENTFAIEHSSTESNVTTFVEVVPASFGIVSPSNAGIASLYGRSVANTIADFYSTVEYVDYNKDKFLDFLNASIKLFNSKFKELLSLKGAVNLKPEDINALLKLKDFINKQSKDNILKSLKNLTDKKVVTTELTTIKAKTETKTSTDFCTGNQVQTITTTSVEERTKEKTVLDVPVDLFSPKELSLLFYSGSINQELFKPNAVLLDYLPPITFNYYTINVGMLMNSLCKDFDNLAKTYFSLSKNSTACYQPNLDYIATLLALGIDDTKLYFNNRTEFGTLVTNFIKTIRIRTSSPVFSVKLSSVDNKSVEKLVQYISSNFAFTLPYVDVNVAIEKKTLLSFVGNLSPDFFIYGLRTKSFQDIFVAVVDAIKNEDKLSTKRAELIRRLNSKPLQTAKVTVLGNQYILGTTTLLVNEKLPPISDFYISEQTLRDIEKDRNYPDSRLFIYINEAVLLKEFSYVYKRLLPKFKGYYPSEKIDEQTIFDYFVGAIKFLLSVSNNSPIPYQYFVPLWGVYTNESINSILGEYLKLLLLDLTYRQPSRQYLAGEYENLYAKFITKNEDVAQIYSQIIKPQNYLVAQGHIESVNYNWSIGSTFTSVLGLNFLWPAIYTYLPYGNGGKLILGYAILSSPASEYNENGLQNEIFNDGKITQLLRSIKKETIDFFNDINLINNKTKLSLLELKLS